MDKALVVSGFALFIIVATVVMDGFYGMHTEMRLNGKPVEPEGDASSNNVWLDGFQQGQKIALTVQVVNNTFSKKSTKKPSITISHQPNMAKPDAIPEWKVIKEFPSGTFELSPFQKTSFTYEFYLEGMGQYRILVSGDTTLVINFGVW